MVRGIPNHIRIGRAQYDVVWQRKILVGSDNSLADGYCDSVAKIIYLRIGMGKRLAFKTLIHELGHALSDEYGVQIPHRLLSDLEAPLEALLRVNRWL